MLLRFPLVFQKHTNRHGMPRRAVLATLYESVAIIATQVAKIATTPQFLSAPSKFPTTSP
jgi:hypothetical protein